MGEGANVQTRVYRNGVCERVNFSPEQISDYLEEPDAVVWLDVTNPTAHEFELIAEEFDLNPLAVEDAVSQGQRPKLDHYDDHVFISLYDVHLNRESGQLEPLELSVFAAPRYLITVRRSSDFEIADVVKRWDDNADLAKYGVGYLLWGLLDVVVDAHFLTVQELDEEIEKLEDLLFDDRPRAPEVQRRSFELRKSLVLLRRVVLPTREVLNSLMRRETNLVDPVLMPYMQDVYDHVLRATDWTESLRDLVTTILETNLTIQGNRLNIITKKVTSWAAIIAVPTAITGFYGQNLPYPGFGQHSGFITSTVVIVVLSIALYVAFKRKDWL